MRNKIAYICSSSSWGGLEINQMKNAAWMKERGHLALILCLKGSPIFENAAQLGIETIQIEKHRKYYDFAAGKRLARIIESQAITHLIVRDTRDMSVSVIAKRNSRTNVHLSYFMEMQLGVKKTNLLHTIRFSYFDLWSCPLNWLAKQVAEMTRFPKDRITVIPSGIDLRVFSKQLSQQEARTMLDLPADKKIIGLIGRFDPHKGQVLLLEALSLLNNKEVVVCFLGEPTRNEGTAYFDLMNSTIERTGLQEQVIIRPFRKDIYPFYKAIDVFVMASKAETVGMVTIESMASGTPVIASNAGGSPELLNQGELGLLFEPLNAQSLAEQLTLFFGGSFSVNSSKLKIASEHFDHHKICERVERALKL